MYGPMETLHPHMWYPHMDSLAVTPKFSSSNLLIVSSQSGNSHPPKLVAMFTLT